MHQESLFQIEVAHTKMSKERHMGLVFEALNCFRAELGNPKQYPVESDRDRDLIGWLGGTTTLHVYENNLIDGVRRVCRLETISFGWKVKNESPDPDIGCSWINLFVYFFFCCSK